MQTKTRLQAENILSALEGGTGNSTYNKGDILYASGRNSLTRLPLGAFGNILTIGSNGTPAWGISSSLPPVSSLHNGDSLYYLNGWQTLGIGLSGTFLVSNGSYPVWTNLFNTVNNWTAQQVFVGSAGIKIGAWEIVEDGNNLVFKRNGVIINVMEG